jgi:hypothetical protein
MPQYMLLLHESATLSPDISATEIQAIIQRYKDWSGALAAKGHMRGGNKLQDGTGRTVRSTNGSVSVSDGPYAESKELVGGYFLIEAASYDEAVALSKDCPHLDFGIIEVREIEPTS